MSDTVYTPCTEARHDSGDMPPLGAREVYQVLKEAALGLRVMRNAIATVTRGQDGDCREVLIDDWSLALTLEAGRLVRCHACGAPDGRRGSLEQWHRAGTDPVAFLSAWELQQVEGLLEALMAQSTPQP